MAEMTTQESINVINNLIRQFERLEQPTAVEGLKIAKDALEKQIPDKWISGCTFWRGVDDYEVWKCPKCRVPNDKPTRYCPHCWQALDWDVEDDE